MHQIASLQYITPQPTSNEFYRLLEQTCLAGCNWTQLRVKDIPYEQHLQIAQQSFTICKKYNTTFIINDNVLLAKELKAHGVHLGKHDMSPREARAILGSSCIIGGTANTFADIKHLVSEGVDYIGLGPFRFTTTKKNLSPILGLDGYSKIMQQCKQANITTPIVAIGGIELTDINAIMETGINGIAASGLITNAVEDNSQYIQQISTIINSHRSADNALLQK